MSLVANYDSNTSSSSEDSEDDEEKISTKEFKLPDLKINESSKANSLADTQQRKLNMNSVYSNPYIKKQEESLSIISKHKELTEAQKQTEKNKQYNKKKKQQQLKLCVNFFKRGSCKYGDDCKFLHSVMTEEHEESTTTTKNNITEETKVAKEACKYRKGRKPSNSFQTDEQQPVCDTDDVIWEGGGMKESRKRIGLSDNVVPSKKALKTYRQQQQK